MNERTRGITAFQMWTVIALVFLPTIGAIREHAVGGGDLAIMAGFVGTFVIWFVIWGITVVVRAALRSN